MISDVIQLASKNPLAAAFALILGFVVVAGGGTSLMNYFNPEAMATEAYSDKGDTRLECKLARSEKNMLQFIHIQYSRDQGAGPKNDLLDAALDENGILMEANRDILKKCN